MVLQSLVRGRVYQYTHIYLAAQLRIQDIDRGYAMDILNFSLYWNITPSSDESNLC